MKFAPSVQTRIASLLILLLALAFGALYGLVKAATGVAVQSQLREDLGLGGRVFEQLLDMRDRQLNDALRVLATDPTLQVALASADREIIRQALASHGTRVKAEVMLLGGAGHLQVGTLAGLSEATVVRLAGQRHG